MAKKPSPRRKSGRGRKSDRWLLIGIVVSVLIIALVLWGPFRKYRPTPGKQPQTRQAAKRESGHAQEQQARETPGATSLPALLGNEAGEKTAFVAVVIDDLGMDLKQAQELVSLPAKITFAVMPGLPQSKKVAELAKQHHRELLLHLPMEYRGKNGKPAPGMLRSDMTPMDFLATVSEDVASVPGAIGVNNHEGSALTENREAMQFLMAELKSRNLLFLDSFTSAKSVAYETARKFGIRSAKRDVFLDNESNNPESIRRQLDELSEIAHKNGKAIGIGHPHPATVSELKKWIAEAGSLGIEIVPVSKLMN